MPIGIAAPLALAGGGIASAVAQSGARNDQRTALQSLLDSLKGTDALGSTPEFTPVDYNPLYVNDPGYRQSVADVLTGDQQNLPLATALTGDINKAITQQSKDRMLALDPSFFGAMDKLYRTRNDVLSGRLPYTDALAVTADRTRLANDLGAGTSTPQIAADLGMKQLDLMTNVGPGLASSIASILNMADPIQRHATPQDYLINPSQAIPWMIGENQFGASFGLQNAMEKATFDAMPNPTNQKMFDLQMMMAGMQGSSNSILPSILSSLGSGLMAYNFMQPKSSAGWFGNNGYISPNGTALQFFGNQGYPIPKALPL